MALHSVPRIGIGVFVLNKPQTKFILGQRKGSIGAGTFALPGGHLELSESFETCAAREVLEETALEVEDLKFLTATNTIMHHVGEVRHYVTIFMTCCLRDETAEPQLTEPDKCAGWEWVTWEKMKALGEAQIKAQNRRLEKQEVTQMLFEPLISLLIQRPGVQPIVPDGLPMTGERP